MGIRVIRSVAMVMLLTGMATMGFAQTVQQFSGWSALFSSTRINSRFSLHFDGQVRSSDEWKEVQTILLRPGLNYHINKKQVATAGYALVESHRRIVGADGWIAEHRIWEQYIINQSFTISRHFTTLQHRFRLEQRFLKQSAQEGNRLLTTADHFSQRLRYFTRAIFPLKRSAAFTNGPFLALQNEIMVNLSNAPVTNGKFFDQNRAYGALGYRFSPKLDMELGYMNQYITGRGDAATSNNILQVAVYTKL